MSTPSIKIAGRPIGADHPVYVVAEMSGNHGHRFERAVQLLEAAREAGADALKLQTYTPDTITIDCENEWFRIEGAGHWAGRTLHQLYGEAYTPWDWQPRLKELGDKLGIEVFSTPFDPSAVDFLDGQVGVAAFKVASFEIVDIPLLQRIGQRGKPVILSTGMASLSEIDRAVRTLREAGTREIALLRCVSSYPANPAQMNLATIPHLASAFSVPVGISDHSLSPAVSVAAVALGACIVEKHFTLSRADGGPDAPFSLEPPELRELIRMIRDTELAIGNVRYEADTTESENIRFRKSIFVVRDIGPREVFTQENVRVIRPGNGLPPVEVERVLGRRSTRSILRGTPLSWDMVGSPSDGSNG